MPHPVVRAHVLNCLCASLPYVPMEVLLITPTFFAYPRYLVGDTCMYLTFEEDHLRFHSQADVVDTRVQQPFDPHGDRIGGN